MIVSTQLLVKVKYLGNYGIDAIQNLLGNSNIKV